MNQPFTDCRSSSRRLFTAMLVSLVSALGLSLAHLQAQMSGVTTGPVTVPRKGVQSGELLLSELNCTACHQASDPVKARLASKESPRLGPAGLRPTPQNFRAFLARPPPEETSTT